MADERQSLSDLKTLTDAAGCDPTMRPEAEAVVESRTGGTADRSARPVLRDRAA